MRLYKRGKIWWVSLYSGGERVRVSTRCHDRQAAESAARLLERDAADPAGAAAKRTTLGQALKALIDEREEQAKAGRKSADTVAFYRKKAAVLSAVLEGDDENYHPFALAHLHSADVDGYISRRRSTGVKDSTISKELVTLRAALKVALRRGLWNGNVAAVCPIAFSPAYKPRERFLASAEEAGRLLEQLSADRAARVAFTLATSAELRATERAQDEDALDGLCFGAVPIRGTKRATRARTVPLVFGWQRTLLELAAAGGAGEGGALFAPWGNIRRDLADACERAGIEPLSHNDLRRTFSHWMSEAGVMNEHLAPMMGHADTRMLDRVYNKKTPEELTRAIARYCDTGVPDKKEIAGSVGLATPPNPAISVPRDGIEPSTRGFSVPVGWRPRWRNNERFERYKRRAVPPVCLRVMGGGRSA
ncbi:MAG TPA: hypothetical protein DCQ64_01185 [Candidatus Rokubacteria bacterium]|nr:hypothetical protein [Candidatus Rokubacteria bacterium]